MIPEKLTERARTIIDFAQEQATRLKHDQIDTEHLLLGLVHEGQGIAARALQELGVSLDRLEMEVKKVVTKPHVLSDDPGRSPVFTRAAHQVFQYAMEEVQRMECDQVGTDQILLGLLREESGRAIKVLADFGVTSEKVRKVLKPLG